MKKIILISILSLSLLVVFASISHARRATSPFEVSASTSHGYALHLNEHKDAVDALLNDSGE